VWNQSGKGQRRERESEIDRWIERYIYIYVDRDKEKERYIYKLYIYIYILGER
jgi:hypothetical protein